MMILTNLERFTRPNEDVWKQPFSLVDPEGCMWAIAIDGVWFIATKTRSFYKCYSGSKKDLKNIAKMIQMEPKNPIQAPLDRLKEWAGKPTYKFDPDNDRQGTLFKVTVNLCRLARLLGEASTEDVTVWDATKIAPFSGLACIGLEAGGWRAFLMGYEEIEKDAPVFDIKAPEKELFDLAMSFDDLDDSWD
jgi:hypothetical protein